VEFVGDGLFLKPNSPPILRPAHMRSFTRKYYILLLMFFEEKLWKKLSADDQLSHTGTIRCPTPEQGRGEPVRSTPLRLYHAGCTRFRRQSRQGRQRECDEITLR
jgi:hypothetical protein